MRQRCNDKNCADFKNYGGRGIKVCKEWADFEIFVKDMEADYKKGLWIDRVDNEGEYSKGNCRWSSPKVQQNNRRDNHLFEYRGVADTLTNWAKFIKMKKSTLEMRIHYGWTFEKSLTTPVKGGYNYF